jgi:hypothetical protein
MEIYLRNETGNWATVKRIAPTVVEGQLGRCITSKSAIGMITIDKILSRDKDASNDIRSMMVVNTEALTQEFYGVVLFEINSDKSWTKQVSEILTKKNKMNLVHPKTAIDGKNYLFFANRYNAKEKT